MTRPAPLAPKLRGRVALVTGSGRGLGRAYALRLARLGADVVITDLRLDSAREYDEELFAETVMDECRSYGVRALGIAADVTDPAQVQELVDRTVAELGSLDILVNNCGGKLRPAEDSSAAFESFEHYRYILDINLTSTVLCCRAACRPMIDRGWGRIVNIASQAGVKGSGLDGASYGLAKSGVMAYTRLLAGQLGPHNITVNALAPAYILSSRALKQDPGRVNMGANIPLRRVGEPEDCAKVVEFFCSDLADYVTGQILGVCGGVLREPF